MNDLDKKLEQKETCKFLQKPCRLTVKSREIFYPRKLQLQLKAGQDPSVFFVEYRTADYTQYKMVCRSAYGTFRLNIGRKRPRFIRRFFGATIF